MLNFCITDNKYIFTIPIYVCSENSYNKRREQYYQKQYKKYCFKDDEEKRKEFNYVFAKFLWRPWKYNQIVGFIDIFIWGKDIRGDLYYVDSNWIGVLLKKKRFEFYGKAFELGIHSERSSKEIYTELLVSCQA